MVLGGADAAGSLYDDVWESVDDGSSWSLVVQSADWSARSNFATVIHKEKGVEYLYIMAGFQWMDHSREYYLNDVWRMRASDRYCRFELVKVLSSSGKFTPRAYTVAMSLNGFIYLIGGCAEKQCSLVHDDVLVSAEGALWSSVSLLDYDQKPTNALWSAFLFANCGQLMGTVHQGTIYLMGRKSETRVARLYPRDTAFSLSVAYVSEIPVRVGGRGRQGGMLFSFLGNLWLLGGMSATGGLGSDILMSADGSEWTLLQTSPAFPARHSFAGTLFRGRICVMGGQSEANPQLVYSDVCCTVLPAFPAPFLLGTQASDVSPSPGSIIDLGADLPHPAAVLINLALLPPKPATSEMKSSFRGSAPAVLRVQVSQGSNLIQTYEWEVRYGSSVTVNNSSRVIFNGEIVSVPLPAWSGGLRQTVAVSAKVSFFPEEPFKDSDTSSRIFTIRQKLPPPVLSPLLRPHTAQTFVDDELGQATWWCWADAAVSSTCYWRISCKPHTLNPGDLDASTLLVVQWALTIQGNDGKGARTTSGTALSPYDIETLGGPFELRASCRGVPWPQSTTAEWNIIVVADAQGLTEAPPLAATTARPRDSFTTPAPVPFTSPSPPPPPQLFSSPPPPPPPPPKVEVMDVRMWCGREAKDKYESAGTACDHAGAGASIQARYRKTAGGDLVQLGGRYMETVVSIDIGGRACTSLACIRKDDEPNVQVALPWEASFVSICQCYSPPGVGAAIIRVSYGGREHAGAGNAHLTLHWVYHYGPPLITGVFSDPGPTAGGGLITLLGVSFGSLMAGHVSKNSVYWGEGTQPATLGSFTWQHLPGVSVEVLVGTSQAQSVIWTSDSCLEISVPPGTGTSHPLRLSYATTDSHVTAASFSVASRVGGGQPGGVALYNYSAPLIHKLEPSEAPPGGFHITLIGTNFGIRESHADRVAHICSRACSYKWFSDTSLILRTPALPPSALVRPSPGLAQAESSSTVTTGGGGGGGEAARVCNEYLGLRLPVEVFVAGQYGKREDGFSYVSGTGERTGPALDLDM